MTGSGKKFYFTILTVTGVLLIIGLYMVYSASFPVSMKYHHSTNYFLKKQLIFAVIGIVVMLAASRIDYNIYKKAAYPLLIFSGIMILLTYFPFISKPVKGAHRWIALGPISIQPSEMAKVFLIMFMAYLLEKKQDKLDDFSYGFLPFILIPGVIMLLVLGQPDFGTFILMGMLIYIMMFVGGVRITYLIGVVAVVIPVLYLLITHSHYRLMRFLVFLDPWKYYSKNGYQVAQSLISFGAGGFIGKGIGCSQQKMFFLPEAYTDYIFSIFAEEMGFFGVFAVVVSFLLFFVTGIKMSMKVQNRFGKLLGIGLTSLITLQAFINFSVCMGLLPPKGITLPFFSYGGSSLVAVMFAVGVLLNLSRNVAND